MNQFNLSDFPLTGTKLITTFLQKHICWKYSFLIMIIIFCYFTLSCMLKIGLRQNNPTHARTHTHKSRKALQDSSYRSLRLQLPQEFTALTQLHRICNNQRKPTVNPSQIVWPFDRPKRNYTKVTIYSIFQQDRTTLNVRHDKKTQILRSSLWLLKLKENSNTTQQAVLSFCSFWFLMCLLVCTSLHYTVKL